METNHGKPLRRFFPTGVDPLRYVPTASHEAAREALHRVIGRGEGPAVVIGAAGLGKTMVCRRLAYELRSSHRTIVLDAMRCTNRRELFQYMMRELRCPYRGLDEAELRLGLLEEVARNGGASGIVVVIDEAHLLPLELLEDLRLLLNLEPRGLPQVRLVLSGAGLLEEHLASPRLESLSQRLAARCYLQPMQCDEVEPYLQQHLDAVHLSVATLFEPDAVRAIYRAADGVPRVVNQLADHSLVLQHLQGRFALPLTADEIEQAWADLQQLPAPWNVAADPTARAETAFDVELGPLDDGPDDPFGAPGLPPDNPPSERHLVVTPPSAPFGSTPNDGRMSSDGYAPETMPGGGTEQDVDEPQIVKFDSAGRAMPVAGDVVGSEESPSVAPLPAADPFDEPFEEEAEVRSETVRIVADEERTGRHEAAASAEAERGMSGSHVPPSRPAVDPEQLYHIIDVGHGSIEPSGLPKQPSEAPLIHEDDIIIETW